MRSVDRASRRFARRRALALALAAASVGLLSLLSLGASSSSRAALGAPGGEPTPQTDNSVPAANVTLIGSSPAEVPAETWGVGHGSGAAVFTPMLVRYTRDTGWSLGSPFQDTGGASLKAFRLAAPEGGRPSPLAGRFTDSGAGVLLGEVPPEEHQVLLVRDPGGAFRETAPLEGAAKEVALKEGESLFAKNRAPLLAAIDEASGRAGALVVPVSKEAPETSVLHWDGSSWTREAIAVPTPSLSDFRVLAIGASSPTNAWLLAQLSPSGPYPPGSVALFRRHQEGGLTRWLPVATTPKAGDEEAHPLQAESATFTVAHTGEPPSVQAQLLTVSAEGIWVDGERLDNHSSTTIYFKPTDDTSGEVQASWCTVGCKLELPQALPSGPSRSFAWAQPGTPYGERVITGLPEGETLRLDSASFTRVLGLGGTPISSPGGSFGAAFSSAREGWLGEQRLPVHLTLEPITSRLTPWPVPFHHALLAIAPQPGAPVGALTSQALAVGDQGEVARYSPGRGWTPKAFSRAADVANGRACALWPGRRRRGLSRSATAGPARRCGYGAVKQVCGNRTPRSPTTSAAT